MTKQRLSPPLAICRLGLIYNYEEVLKLMLEKRIPHQFSHIRNIKDLRNLENIEFNSEKNSDFPLICPISKTEYNGLNRFKAYWSCGCMCSEKAIEQIAKKEKICIVCGKKFDSGDEISLNLTADEQSLKKQQLLLDIQKKNQKKEEKKHNEEEKSTKKRKLNNGEAKSLNANPNIEPYKNILDQIHAKNESSSTNGNSEGFFFI